MYKIKKTIKSVYLFIRTILLNVFCFLLSPNVEIPENGEIKKILIIRNDRHGDVVLSTPFMQEVRDQFKNAHIAVLLQKQTAGLLQEADFIDEIIEYTDDIILQYQNFDCVFDLISDHTLKTAILTYKTKAKYRIGFDIAGRGVFFNIKVKTNSEDEHFVDQTFSLLKAMGIEVGQRRPMLPISKRAKEFIHDFFITHDISTSDLFICIHPGAYFKSQRWKPDRFSQLADHLIEEYKAKVVLIGTSNEADLINTIHQKMNNGRDVILFLGHPIEYVTALLKGARLLVCNNSGPLHMATAVNTPTVSTMGPTLKDRWWPRGDKHIVIRKEIECIGCNKGYCPTKTHNCMEQITVDDMVKAVKMQMTRI